MCRSDREPDAAMRALAEEEAAALSVKLRELESGLLLRLLPKNMGSGQGEGETGGAILEVRSGAGGEEASLFASKLMTMYQHYAERKGWHFEVSEQVNR